MTEPQTETQNLGLHALRERCTGMQRPEEFMREPGMFHLDEQNSGKIEPAGFATRREYVLELTVGCRYWCNDAQHSEARKNAESVLADALYRDVLIELNGIRHAVYDGDRMAALRRIAALEQGLRR